MSRNFWLVLNSLVENHALRFHSKKVVSKVERDALLGCALLEGDAPLVANRGSASSKLRIGLEVCTMLSGCPARFCSMFSCNCFLKSAFLLRHSALKTPSSYSHAPSESELSSVHRVGPSSLDSRSSILLRELATWRCLNWGSDNIRSKDLQNLFFATWPLMTFWSILMLVVLLLYFSVISNFEWYHLTNRVCLPSSQQSSEVKHGLVSEQAVILSLWERDSKGRHQWWKLHGSQSQATISSWQTETLPERLEERQNPGPNELHLKWNAVPSIPNT